MASLKCVINVTNTTGATTICKTTTNFSDIIYNDVSIGVRTSYIFDSMGDHTLYFVLKDSTFVESRAFYECSKLREVEIPDGVTTIKSSAFGWCKSLWKVKLPNSVTVIDWGAFKDDEKIGNFTVSNSLHTIGEQAFANCTILPFSMPSTVRSIGEGAFSACKNLRTVVIPEGVTSIPDDVFMFCDSITSVSIPSTVTYIGDSAFNNCGSLLTVDIPEGVKKIVMRTFYGCSALTSVNLPSTLESIDSFAFNRCSSLQEIDIPEGTTTLSGAVFANCTSLKTVYIPSTLTKLNGNVFSGCTSLNSIYVYTKTLPPLSEGAFAGVATGGTLSHYAGTELTWLNEGSDLYNYEWESAELKGRIEAENITIDNYSQQFTIPVTYYNMADISVPTKNVDWLALVEGTTENGTKYYNYRAERNAGDERSARITLSGTDTFAEKVKTSIVVTQSANVPSIAPYKLVLDYPSTGGTKYLQVDYTNATTIRKPSFFEDWLTIEESQRGNTTDSNGNTVIQVQYRIIVTSTEGERNSTITFSCTDKNGTVYSNDKFKVHQEEPLRGSLSLLNTVEDVPYEGGTTTATFECMDIETIDRISYTAKVAVKLTYEFDGSTLNVSATLGKSVNVAANEVTVNITTTDLYGNTINGSFSFKQTQYQIPQGYITPFVDTVNINADGTPFMGAEYSDIGVGYSGITIGEPIVDVDWLTLGEGVLQTGVFYGYDKVYRYPWTATPNTGDTPRVGTITFVGTEAQGLKVVGTVKMVQAIERSEEDDNDIPVEGDEYCGPIWKDIEYDFGSIGEVNYCIYTTEYTSVGGAYVPQDKLLYSGKSCKRPNMNTNRIMVNKICQNYLAAPVLVQNAYTVYAGYQTFKLTDEGGSVIYKVYRFINDWSYDDFKTGLLSRPILNDRTVVRGQKLPFTVFGAAETEEIPIKIVYNNGFTDEFGEQVSDWNSKVSVVNNVATEFFPYGYSAEGVDYYSIGDTDWKVVNDCSVDYVLYYVNPWGGYDWFPVRGKVTEIDDITQYVYTQNYSNQSWDFGKRRYLSEINKKYQLHTHWLREEESKRMWYLLQSNTVYLHNIKTDKIDPVIITATQQEHKQRGLLKNRISYQIDIELSQTRERL